MAENHELFGGKLHVYRRPDSRNWHCSTYLAGRNWRLSTRKDSLKLAKEVAEDWYLRLRGKSSAGDLKFGRTFAQAAEKFSNEYEIITEGERSPLHLELVRLRLDVHLLPFFGKKYLSEVTPGLVQEYRVHRMTSRKNKTTGLPMKPARSTLEHEITVVRQVLRTAHRHQWLPYLPDLTAPYKMSGKVGHRAWFSPEEYKTLYTATRERASPSGKWPR